MNRRQFLKALPMIGAVLAFPGAVWACLRPDRVKDEVELYGLKWRRYDPLPPGYRRVTIWSKDAYGSVKPCTLR